ncbi:MAG: CRISPR-associated endonuclease Cas1 1 [Saprospiraceae bacterium]|nr:CRISPR-associated endonuclease Cas1 1 [Saprospiraceae bacterium]
MQLYLDSFGAYLSVRNGQFRVRLSSGEERLFAVRQVSAVLLTKGTGLSTDAALLAVENDIPVLLLDAQTHYPLAQVGSGRPGNIATVRKNQAAFSRSSEGFAWVADCIARKIEGQRALLRHLAERPAAPPGFTDDIRVTDRIFAALEQGFRDWHAPAGPLVPGADPADVFRGQEGTASRIYFQKIATWLAAQSAIPNPQSFEGRRKRPAYDPFNALLNYLYGMLYTSVHLSLLKSGLDPYLGVLHADRYGGSPTLVFDAIEPYRPWADRVAVQLVESGQVNADFFEPDAEERGLWLSSAGKSAVIDAMLAFMENSTPYDRRQVKRKVQIDLDAQKLAVRVKEMG